MSEIQYSFKYDKISYAFGQAMIVDEILSIAKELWTIKESFSKAKKERRKELATYFENISKCLEESAKVLRTGDIPHRKCGEMLGYAKTFKDTVKGVIGKKEAEDFAKRLGDNYDIEYAVSDIVGDVREKTNQIDKIEEASGVFQALANSIRAR